MNLSKKVKLASAVVLGLAVIGGAAQAAKSHWYEVVYYSDASKTNIVGLEDSYCGSGVVLEGQRTAHFDRRSGKCFNGGGHF